MSYRIGVDTGGTFTDVSLIEESTGKMYITKVPSTPENVSIGVLNGVKEIIENTNIKYKDLNFFIHGSTVATNALLERKGAKSALLTTKGFKDVLQIGRQTRPKLYDFRARKSDPFIPRNLRIELNERIDAQGNVMKSVDYDEVLKIGERLKNENIESLAICFINSYLNPINEMKVKEILEGVIPDTSITLSFDVLPEIKEYERTSTVVANAYVLPKMKSYLKFLETSIKKMGIPSSLYIMQSNGGVISTDTAITMPVRTILSGPAGGVIAGSIVANKTSSKDLITIDMGGTSLDAALIKNGNPQYTTTSEIEGHPIKVPMIEMHTIGSGGGSIAWIDSGGALRVGPHSAGANPGPVCYGKGGTEVTVSDANVILGRLNPESILGGKMKLDLASARKVLNEKIAIPLGVSIEEAAEGILKVVNANMVRGIRVVSIEKGHDTRDFSLMAFGGAGPLHAVDIALELGCKEVLVPPSPGITCAIGMLMADVRHDYVKSFTSKISKMDYKTVNNVIYDLEQSASLDLKKEGFQEERTEFKISLDLRYCNQAFEINIPLKENYVSEEVIADAIEEFHQTHEKVYGFDRRDEDLEVVNVRGIGLGIIEKIQIDEKASGSNGEGATSNKISTRSVYFGGSYIETTIYKDLICSEGLVIKGPAIIEQFDTTIVIHPSFNAQIDQYGNIVIKSLTLSVKEEEYLDI